MEPRRAGAEVEGEGARAARAPNQHPQEVILADRAGRAAAVVSVLADAEKRGVSVSLRQCCFCGVGGAPLAAASPFLAGSPLTTLGPVSRVRDANDALHHHHHMPFSQKDYC